MHGKADHAYASDAGGSSCDFEGTMLDWDHRDEPTQDGVRAWFESLGSGEWTPL